MDRVKSGDWVQTALDSLFFPILFSVSYVIVGNYLLVVLTSTYTKFIKFKHVIISGIPELY